MEISEERLKEIETMETGTDKGVVSTGGLDAKSREAIKNLYEIGAACKRCGWGDNETLWATEELSIKVKYLTALRELYIRI